MVISKTFELESSSHNPSKWKQTPGLITPINNCANVLITNNLIINGSILNPSDITLKENISDINNNEYDNIMKINPKKYKYKSSIPSIIGKDDGNFHYGFIAQDFEHFFPNLCVSMDKFIDIEEKCDMIEDEKINNDEKIKTINYIELIPLIIGKMQEMESEIKELKSKLNINK